MRILIACEYSGVVRSAFDNLEKKHEVWSCDFLPTEIAGLHYQGDVTKMLDGWAPVTHQSNCDPQGENLCEISCKQTSECKCFGPNQDGLEYTEINGELFARPLSDPHWDLMIAHPPCQYLSVSGMHWTTRGLRDPELTEQALVFVQKLLDAPINRIALENPVSIISSRIRKPNQIVQPWMFGHDASKKTCLWLKNLPNLIATNVITKDIYANQTPSGQNKLGPSKDRWKIRSKTFSGIAEAMANSWG